MSLRGGAGSFVGSYAGVPRQQAAAF